MEPAIDRYLRNVSFNLGIIAIGQIIDKDTKMIEYIEYNEDKV